MESENGVDKFMKFAFLHTGIIWVILESLDS